MISGTDSTNSPLQSVLTELSAAFQAPSTWHRLGNGVLSAVPKAFVVRSLKTAEVPQTSRELEIEWHS